MQKLLTSQIRVKGPEMYGRDKYLFVEGNLNDAIGVLSGSIQGEVDRIPEAQFLSSSDEAIVEHLMPKMEKEPITLHEDQKVMEQDETNVDVSGRPDHFCLPGDGPVFVSGIRLTI